MSDGLIHTSIIIPTRNRVADLRRCLSILIPQLPHDDSVDIHICDDSDGHGTETLLKEEFPTVKRHVGPRTGPGANRNVGAHAVASEWLIFLDDDCLPHPAIIPSYLTAIQATTTPTMLSGPVLRNDEHRGSLLWEAPHNALQHELPPSCNFAMPRSLYLESGGFDERFRYSFEDMEFFARLIRMDIPARFVPEAGVDHPSRSLPPASKLALRWESRVISSFDFGADSSQIRWLLPRHVALVIFSRFRGRKPCLENLHAAWIFFLEFLLMLRHLPGWITKFSAAPRSPFWVDQVNHGKGPARFGL
ncbi:hypothetical protein BH09VER1_BH09VER1_52430 [soil metagenome]